MSKTEDLWGVDLSKLVHDRFPNIPDVTPKHPVCWHGNVAAGCTPCERDRLRKKRKGEP